MTDLDVAVAAVLGQVDPARADAWFTAVCAAHEASGEDWAAFKDALAAEPSFGPAVVDAFVAVMETDVADPIDVLGQFAEHRDTLPQLYADLAAGHQAPAADDGTQWDDETAVQWYRYLTEENNWAGWTGGDEAAWAEFSEWFLQFAEQAEVRSNAQVFLARMGNDPDGPTAALAKLGIETGPAEVSAEASAGQGWGEQTAAWYVALTTDKGWGGWTGAEADWPQFTEWFGHHAELDGVSGQAQHFLDEVAADTDKVAALARFGITIDGEAGDAEAPPAVLARIEAEATGEILAAAAGEVPDGVPQEDVDQLIAQLMRDRVAARG
jgi:hypothetical protein